MRPGTFYRKIRYDGPKQLLSPEVFMFVETKNYPHGGYKHIFLNPEGCNEEYDTFFPTPSDRWMKVDEKQ